MKMTAKADSERFQSDANQYAAYLETPEGRLRSDLAFANLQDFLPRRPKLRCALLISDAVPGATAVRLARLGIQVTLLDSSPAMLDIAKRAAREAGVAEKIVLQHGDAAQLANLFPTRSFDVILCHNILEYCRRPGCCVARCGSRLAGFVGDIVRSRTQPGRRSIQGRYPGGRFGCSGKWPHR